MKYIELELKSKKYQQEIYIDTGREPVLYKVSCYTSKWIKWPIHNLSSKLWVKIINPVSTGINSNGIIILSTGNHGRFLRPLKDENGLYLKIDTGVRIYERY